jgi:hypothetical protein
VKEDAGSSCCSRTLVVGSACATSQQWADWRQHSSHFASGDHLVLSLRNERQSATPRVTRRDLDEARTERWWGDPVVVRADRLADR